MNDHSKVGGGRGERASQLRWVALGELGVSVHAQRKFSQTHTESIAAEFDLEKLGFPVVSSRDGSYWIVDGQHRIAAAKMFGFTDTDTIQCEVYEGLTEKEEAEFFLGRDFRRGVHPFDKFRIAVTAERTVETAIQRLANVNGIKISKSDGISCVGTLKTIYERSGPVVLGRTLRIIRDAYGDAGYDRAVVDGVAMVCARYGDQFSAEDATAKLGNIHGGVNGLLGAAAKLRLQTGNAKSSCVAGAVVEALNKGRATGKRLASWWKV